MKKPTKKPAKKSAKRKSDPSRIEDRLVGIANAVSDVRANVEAIARVISPLLMDLRSRGVPGNISTDDMARVTALTDGANDRGVENSG